MDEGMAKRIQRLRQEQQMTLEQVADIVGVGKSTVRKWETGMIANMKRDKISDLAKALHTTPAYLMGWEENKKSSLESVQLTEEEIQMVLRQRQWSDEEKMLFKNLWDTFDRMPAKDRAMILGMIEAAAVARNHS